MSVVLVAIFGGEMVGKYVGMIKFRKFFDVSLLQLGLSSTVNRTRPFDETRNPFLFASLNTNFVFYVDLPRFLHGRYLRGKRLANM